MSGISWRGVDGGIEVGFYENMALNGVQMFFWALTHQ